MKINSKVLLKNIFKLKGQLNGYSCENDYDKSDIYIAPFYNGSQATVNISADFELNWAWRELPIDEMNKRGIRARKNFPLILNALEKFKTPITWATVGHLFLQSCENSIKKMAHSNMPRPPVNMRWKGDWYKHDPCTSAEMAPLWYAPDLIEEILNNKVNHEIGTHSFSHIDFDSSTSNKLLVEAEMEACANAMAKFDLKPRSLVYPFNHMGDQYLDILSDYGITSVRQRKDYINIAYPERMKSGIYKIYETTNIRRPKYYDLKKKIEIYIEEAIKNRTVVHLWFHPSDFTGIFEHEFLDVLKVIKYYRDKYKIWIATMAETAAYLEARRSKKITATKVNERELSINISGIYDINKYGPTNITLTIKCERKPNRVNAFYKKNAKETIINDFWFDKKMNVANINIDTDINRIKICF